MATLTFYPSSVPSSVWTNPSNGYANDGTYVTHSPAKNNTSYQEYSGFDFSSIASGSTINSLTVNAEYKVNTNGSIANFYLAALKSGSVSGTELDHSSEPTTDTVVNQSSTGTWAYADLANFTLRAGFKRGNSNTAVTLSMDYVSVTIDYTEPTNQSKSLSASVGASGTVSRVASFLKALSATVGGTPSMTRTPNILVHNEKTLTASVTASGSMSRTPTYYAYYVIERKAGVGGTYAEVAQVSTSVLEYTDCSEFVDGTTYYYRVKKIIGTLESPYSNEEYITYLGGATTTDKSLSASVTVASVNGKAAFKLNLAAVNASATVQKSVTQTLLGFVQASASHAKAVGKGLVSNVILTALKSADISKVLSATANASSTITRAITQTLSATVNASATARRVITQVLSAAVNTANAVLQRTARSFTATVNTVSSLARQRFKTLVATVNTLSDFTIRTAEILWEKTLTASVFVVYDVLPKTWGDLYASTWNELTAYTWGDFLVQGGTHIKRRTGKNNLSASAQTVSSLSRFPLKVIVATVSIAATLAYIFGRRLVDKTTYVVVHSFRIVLSAVKAGARALFTTHDMKLAISAVKSAPYRLYCTHTFRLGVNWRMGADPRGENIRMVLGETKIIELFVQDEDGAAADLTGATAIFAVEGGSADKACVVDGNKITVTIGASDIAKVGTFGYEFRIRDALLQVDSLVKGKIFVDPKLTSTF